MDLMSKIEPEGFNSLVFPLNELPPEFPPVPLLIEPIKPKENESVQNNLNNVGALPTEPSTTEPGSPLSILETDFSEAFGQQPTVPSGFFTGVFLNKTG